MTHAFYLSKYMDACKEIEKLRQERDELSGIVCRAEFRATLEQQAKLERELDALRAVATAARAYDYAFSEHRHGLFPEVREKLFDAIAALDSLEGKK